MFTWTISQRYTHSLLIKSTKKSHLVEEVVQRKTKASKACKEKLKWETRRKNAVVVGFYPTGNPAAVKNCELSCRNICKAVLLPSSQETEK